MGGKVGGISGLPLDQLSQQNLLQQQQPPVGMTSWGVSARQVEPTTDKPSQLSSTNSTSPASSTSSIGITSGPSEGKIQALIDSLDNKGPGKGAGKGKGAKGNEGGGSAASQAEAKDGPGKSEDAPGHNKPAPPPPPPPPPPPAPPAPLQQQVDHQEEVRVEQRVQDIAEQKVQKSIQFQDRKQENLKTDYLAEQKRIQSNQV